MNNLLAQYPLTLISCPCSDSLPRDLGDIDDDDDVLATDEATFDPRAPRSAFSLFPLENLLFCEDCNQVRCPRCVQDEIVCYYCPSCLFEVPSSTVKSEGNRCTRNCFNCPICSATLGVVSLGEDKPVVDSKTGQPSGQVAPGGPWILLCTHCLWSSSDIGIKFQKPTSIATQLAAKLKSNATAADATVGSPDLISSTSHISGSTSSYFATHTTHSDIMSTPDPAEVTDEEAFTRLKAHYSYQKSASTSDDGSLSRLMGLYSTSGGRIRSYGANALTRSAKGKSDWQEAEVRTVDGSADAELVEKMREVGFEGTATQAQRLGQSHNPRLTSEVRPIAALLRSKRSKRCRACRHILVKPENKVSTIRYRIRLVAMNYIPALSLSRLDAAAVSYLNLQPLTTHQFLLTVTNPLFDPVSIHLATPEKTPGRFQTTVTIICPQFEIGANADVWDEALNSTPQPNRSMPQKSKGSRQAIAGTIWDCGRNWTTVIMEIVPPIVPDDADVLPSERIVKVPILVRSTYETDPERDGDRGQREKREHSYWSVVEVGKIGKRLDPNAVPASRPVSLASSTGRRDNEGSMSGRVNRHSTK